jgi:hypothetical protein
MIGLGLGATHASPLQAATEVDNTISDTKAFEFDGTNDVVIAPASVDIFNGSGGSISFWAKDADFSNKTFINKYSSGDNQWAIGIQEIAGNDAMFFQGVDDAGGGSVTSKFYSSFLSNLTNYNHFVVVVDDSSTSNFLANSKIYVNGSATSSIFSGGLNVSATVDFDNTGSLLVGASTNTARTHVDEINEIAFFSTALSAAEVTAIYNSGTPTNLTVNKGDYASASSLELYIRGEETIGSAPQFPFTDSSGNSVSCFALGNSIIDSTL